MCGPSGSSSPQSCSCCAMTRFGSLMVLGQTLPSKIGTQRRKNVRMGKSHNGKWFRETSSRTRRKRWKRRKNRCKRAHHPNARFLEWWFPSISNDGRKVPSPWWNVLTVEELVHSPQARASSGSLRMTDAKCRRRFRACVGRHQTKRTGAWLEDRATNETKDVGSHSFLWTGSRLSQ